MRRDCAWFTFLALQLALQPWLVLTLPRFQIAVSVYICPHLRGCKQGTGCGDLGSGTPASHSDAHGPSGPHW